jgi:hypothetical protein
MENDREFLANNHSFPALLVDELDPIPPHPEANLFDCGATFSSPLRTEPLKGAVNAVIGAHSHPVSLPIRGRSTVRKRTIRSLDMGHFGIWF